MPDKSYGQLSQEISQAIERLESIELQAQAVRQDLAKLLAQRQTIESGLGLGGRAHRNSSSPAKQTTATREASALIRRFWEQNADQLQVPFRKSGPIPADVKAAYSKR